MDDLDLSDGENFEITVDARDPDLQTALNLLVNADPSMLARLELLMTDLSARSSPVTSHRLEPVIGVDFFSGIAMRGSSRPIVKLSNGHDYDARFLSDFILETRETRLPTADASKYYECTSEDLIVLGEAVVESRERLKLLSDTRQEERTHNDFSRQSGFIKSVVNFATFSAEAAAMQLLGACELTAIRSLQDLQVLFEDMWLIIVRCFGVLLRCHPLYAARLAQNMFPQFDEASTNTLNHYLYEISAITPVAANVKALCLVVINAIVSGTEISALNSMQALVPARIG